MFERYLEKFLELYQARLDEYYSTRFPTLPREKIIAMRGSRFIRLVRTNDEDTRRSAQGFVALADGETKFLGRYKQGDIFMAASWKAPAKHARGSIFADDPLSCVTPQGHIKYMEEVR